MQLPILFIIFHASYINNDFLSLFVNVLLWTSVQCSKQYNIHLIIFMMTQYIDLSYHNYCVYIKEEVLKVELKICASVANFNILNT